MLLGQSIFQSVLTRLDQENPGDEAEDTGVEFRIRSLGMGFVAATVETDVEPASRTDAYLAFEPDPEIAELEVEPEPEAPPPVPAHLMRLSEREIAEDLGLSDADTETSLGEKRRQFAKANHPDRVAPEYREMATIRMTTANLLIDRAIKNSFWR